MLCETKANSIQVEFIWGRKVLTIYILKLWENGQELPV